jgi:lipopolysaccharide transport system ATP-binding protein
MKPAIRVEGLSKSYKIGARQGEYRTLRESIMDAATAPWRRFRGLPRRDAGPSADGEAGTSPERIWALKDVSFEVQPGEVVGIIGHNGAGKSTLLKILSQVVEPSGGRAEFRGRIGSLLEVGTGFHPELTGRENIFLNGAILGMSRREITRKFAEIVAFAEIDPFLDTPVKRYSSGMYVRLAFAVAAHLDPEILVIDEVLAVGDVTFQRKCLGRMRQASRGGRTVLFVSHNLAAIEALCGRALLLEHGRIVREGEAVEVTRDYYRAVHQSRSDVRASLADVDRESRGDAVLESAHLMDESGRRTDCLPLGGLFHLRIGLRPSRPIDEPTIGLGIDDAPGQRLLSLHTPLSRGSIGRIDAPCAVDCRVPVFPLAPGDYWIKLALTVKGSVVDAVDRAVHFSVVDGDAFGEGRGFHRGFCVAPSAWNRVDGPELDQ